jgi:hypothetical protein
MGLQCVLGGFGRFRHSGWLPKWVERRDIRASPRQRLNGSTKDEAGRRLPGDELPTEADGIATRAITINAPPSALWPWIAKSRWRRLRP